MKIISSTAIVMATNIDTYQSIYYTSLELQQASHTHRFSHPCRDLVKKRSFITCPLSLHTSYSERSTEYDFSIPQNLGSHIKHPGRPSPFCKQRQGSPHRRLHHFIRVIARRSVSAACEDEFSGFALDVGLVGVELPVDKVGVGSLLHNVLVLWISGWGGKYM